MVTAELYCTLVLLLYLQVSHGQQTGSTNQNIGGNNPVGLQQQSIQWMPNNMNKIPNGGLNINLVQQPMKQQCNLQQSATKQGNIQSHNVPIPQNGFQITKIGFTPVSSGTVNNPCTSTMQLQNGNVKPAVQGIQPQNIPISNAPVNQMSNAPMSTSTLSELLGQSSLLSLINPQNNGQFQQNQQIVMPNSIPAQNQLTDVQKQYLVKSLQANQQTVGQNQQGINVVQSQANAANMGNQAVGIRTIQGTPQQGQAIVTTLGNQPAYVTVQAQPLTSYLQYQTPQVTVEEEPSIMSLILSELDPQYSMNSAYPQSKGSKPNLKTLIPLIINLIKEKNACNCQNCGCPNNACQNNNGPNNMMLEPMAQMFGGYSSQKQYGLNSEDSSKSKKKDDETKKSDKERNNKKAVIVESEESLEDNDSEYIDDGDE